MNWFKNLLPWQKMIIVITGSVFILYLFMSMISPKLAKIKSLKTEILKKEQELIEAKQKKVRLALLEKEYDSLKKELKFAQEKLPATENIPDILQKITDIAAFSNINFVSFQPQKEIFSKKDAEGKIIYLELPISIEIQGNYFTLKDFLYKIAKLPRIVTIETMTITPLVDIKEEIEKTNTIKVMINLKIYMYNEEITT